MTTMSWVTSWEAWRDVMGRQGTRQRRNVMAYLETHPAILYWGDSWFSTPLYLNLARQSARNIHGLGIIIGKPGAQAADLFSEREVERIGDRVEKDPFDVVCLSAGGNDCLSERLALVFAEWTGKASDPARIDARAAYDIFRRSDVLVRVREAYDRVLARLREVQQARPHLRVIGHPYVPIHFVGREAELTSANIGLIAWLKDSVGPWLWAPMRHVLEDEGQGREFARLMLEDGFRDGVLRDLARTYPGLFEVVTFPPSPDFTSQTFWNDEIHPGEEGFAHLARDFNATLAQALLPGKRAAVTNL